MHRFPACLIAFLLSVTMFASLGHAQTRVDIDEFTVSRWVTDNRDALKLPSIAVGIVGPKSDHYLELYGPAEATDAFLIGSLSKSVTAMAVLLLVEDGKIALTDPASKWLSAVPADVTVLDLLHQVSGLEHDDAISAYSAENSIEQRIAAATFGPRGTYAYSELNYEILAAIVEQAAQTSFAQFVDARIFKPLGMKNSTAGVEPPSARARGHQFWFGFPQPANESDYASASVGARFIWMSPEDMTRWLRVFLTGGSVDGKQVFPTKIIDQLLAKPETDYAMGWEISSRHAPVQVARHNAESATFTAAMALAPEREFGVFVFTNVNSWMALAPTTVLDGILSSILGGPRAEASNLEFIVRLVFGLVVGLVLFTFLFELLRWMRAGFPLRLNKQEGLRAAFTGTVTLGSAVAAVIFFKVSVLDLLATQPDVGYGFLAVVVLGSIRAFVTGFNRTRAQNILDAD